jgi:hypothetical protein
MDNISVGEASNKRKSTSMAMRLWPKPESGIGGKLYSYNQEHQHRSLSYRTANSSRGGLWVCGHRLRRPPDRLRFPLLPEPVNCLPRPNTHGYHSQQRNDDNALKRRTRTRATALTAIGADIGSPKRRYQRLARTADTCCNSTPGQPAGLSRMGKPSPRLQHSLKSWEPRCLRALEETRSSRRTQ